MKLTLQGLKNKQGLQSRFQLRLKSLGFKNAKLQKQRYTLSNYVFASSYNNQFKNSDDIKRLKNLSQYDDEGDNLSFLSARQYRQMTLRIYVNMKDYFSEIFRKERKHTLRSFILKSETEEICFQVCFTERKR